MTLFNDERYDWRETYFVYFESAHRPKLTEIRRSLRMHAPFLDVLDTKTEQDGRIIEMTIASYEDHAALEIVYREGEDILTEAQNLALSLKEEAVPEELLKLHIISQYTTRLDVHHFEQTADTRAFNTTKIPELKFAKQSTQPAEHVNVFAKALGEDTASKAKFYFDSDSYNRCRHGGTGVELNITEDSAMLDSGEIERINPEMLVTVLEVLCRISRGVALDPASGIVL